MTAALYTHDQMLEELRVITYQWARVNAAIFGRQAGYSVLSVPLDTTLPEIQDPIYRLFQAGMKTPIAFDLRSLNIAKQMAKLYSYGIQGERSIYFDGIEDGTDESVVCNFIRDAASSKALQDLSHGEAVSTKVCEYVVQIAIARSILDGHDRFYWGDEPHDLLTLREISLLSGLDERTVRNATTKTASNRLRTTNLGPKVYVQREAARNWLASKKGFLPTQLIPDVMDENLDLRHFRRPRELSSYLAALRRKQRLSVKAIISAAAPALDAERLKRIEEGDLSVDPASLIKLAQVLGIPDPEKLAAYAEALQKVSELEGLKQRLGGLWPENPSMLEELLRGEPE